MQGLSDEDQSLADLDATETDATRTDTEYTASEVWTFAGSSFDRAETADDDVLAGGSAEGQGYQMPAGRKKARSLAGFFLKFVLMAAVASLAAISGWRISKGTEVIDVLLSLPLKLESQGLQLYENALTIAANELDETWRRSSKTVQDAFRTQFLPDMVSENQIQSRLPLFQELVQTALGSKMPSEADSEATKIEYVLRLLLVRSVVRAAIIRLESLSKLEEFCKDKGVGLEILGQPMPRLPYPETWEKETNDLVSFPEFIGMIEDRDMDRSARRHAGNQKIPKELAQKLAALVLAADMRAKADRKVHNIFHDFLDICKFIPLAHQASYEELDELPMSGEETPFPISIFTVYLSGFDKSSKDGYISPHAIASFANNWTANGSLQQLEMMQQQERKWLYQLRHAKLHHQVNWRIIIARMEESKPPRQEKKSYDSTESLLSLAVFLL